MCFRSRLSELRSVHRFERERHSLRRASASTNKFRTIRERKCSGEIKRDATVEVVDAKSGCKTHLRLVEYRFLGTRKKWPAIRVLTNRTDLTAKQIARIYAWRWKIEIFRTHSGLLKHDKSI
ncbi:transposase [Paenibacillus lycopersici]|uniref:Transposase n=1 Tax=Paenibacillus lycopersici TaxID=2704462 RepID=A0A6C0G8I0_9BACL|nr:transposase [Paenibacillus lycopersici]